MNMLLCERAILPILPELTDFSCMKFIASFSLYSLLDAFVETRLLAQFSMLEKFSTELFVTYIIHEFSCILV